MSVCIFFLLVKKFLKSCIIYSGDQAQLPSCIPTPPSDGTPSEHSPKTGNLLTAAKQDTSLHQKGREVIALLTIGL